jgi:choline-sulfatase
MKYGKQCFSLLLMVFLSVSFIFVNCGKQKRIKIVLISIDTLRGDSITPYGYSRDTTPHLNELVKDSVYFPHAYTNGCWTMPSHMSMLTGTLPSRHGVNKGMGVMRGENATILHDAVKLLPEILKASHPRLKTVKFARLPGDLGFARGFDINNTLDPFRDEESFKKLLKEFENQTNRDFFFFVHTWMVHAPYAQSRFLRKGKISEEKRKQIDGFRRMTRKERLQLIKKKKSKGAAKDFAAFLSRNKLFNMKDCKSLYDSGIYYVDQFVDRLIGKLKELDMYDDVLIIITSDHGEHFDDHFKNSFYSFHGQDFHEEFIKVPLIIKYPNQSKGQIMQQPVSLIDVVPTVLNNYQMKIPDFVQGESLMIQPAARKNRHIISEAVVMKKIEKKMIRVGNLKYILTMVKPNKPGRVNWDRVIQQRLYNLEEDPLEKKNLFEDEKFKNTCLNFEKALKRILKASAKYGPSKETKLDEETINQLKQLGYIQ